MASNKSGMNIRHMAGNLDSKCVAARPRPSFPRRAILASRAPRRSVDRSLDRSRPHRASSFFDPATLRTSSAR